MSKAMLPGVSPSMAPFSSQPLAILPTTLSHASTASLFIPANGSSLPGVASLLQLPHTSSVASQQSCDSTSTVINAQHPFPTHAVMLGQAQNLNLTPKGVLYAAPAHMPSATVPTSQAISGSKAVAVATAAKPTRGRGKGKKAQAAAAAAAAATATAATATAATAAPAIVSHSSTADIANKGSTSIAAGRDGAAAPAPRKKRGPYKKRVKVEGEQKPAPKLKKAAGPSSLMPALEHFHRQVKQEREQAMQQGWVDAPDMLQGPSKKPRQAVKLCRLHVELLPGQIQSPGSEHQRGL